MKQLISIILLLSFTFTAKTQANVADSLKNELSKTTNDSLRIVLYYKISDVYAYFKNDSALNYAQEGLSLARETGSILGEARCLTRLGNIYNEIGNFPKALETHLSSLKLSETIGDETGMAASYNNMAEVYKEQGDYRNAQNYYSRTETIFKKIISDIEADKKTALSETYRTRIWNNKHFLGITYLNIGDAYEKMNILDSSLLFQNRAHELATAIEDDNIIGATLSNLGGVRARMGALDIALANYRRSIPYLEMSDDKEFLSLTYYGIGDIFRLNGLMDSAIIYAHKSLESARQGSFQKEILHAALLLSQIHEKRRRPDSAFIYQKIASEVKDSLFSQEQVRKVEAINFNEQDRQRELTEARKKAAKERSDSLQYIAISIFIITFFVALILLRRKRTKARLIQYLGIIGLLLLFEFIALFIHPYIGNWTHHTPVYMLVMLVGVAAILTPLHHVLTNWVKNRLAKRNARIEQELSAAIHENPSMVLLNDPMITKNTFPSTLENAFSGKKEKKKKSKKNKKKKNKDK